MTAFNPDERIETPTIGVPKVGTLKIPFANTFGKIYREEYEIVETDEPYLLWENGSAMVWEDGDSILLEQQLMRIYNGQR